MDKVFLNSLDEIAAVVKRQTITSLTIVEASEEEMTKIHISLADTSMLEIYDIGDDGGAYRYITTDDDLSVFIGAEVYVVILKEYKEKDGDHGDIIEIQFLEIVTNIGPITFVCHNEHNGWYGGFNVVAIYTPAITKEL